MAAMVAISVVAAACSGGDEETADLVSQSESGSAGVDENQGNVGDVPAPVRGDTDTSAEDADAVDGSESEDEAEDEVDEAEAGAEDGGDVEDDSDGTTVSGEACRAFGYQLQTPTGWFHFECTHFSPEPISVNPVTCNCQFPIDAAVARNESFDEAVDRIASRPDIWQIEAEQSLLVDGRFAVQLDTLVEVAGRTVDRRLIVVDLGNGTLFLAATDRADQGPGSLVYDDVLDRLDTMLDSVILRPL